MIYGHSVVEVVKQRDQCRWIVTTSEGKELVGVPWRVAFDQTELILSWSSTRNWTERNDTEVRGQLSYNKDKLAALEVCLLMAPLDDEDLRAFFVKYPGFEGKNIWAVDRSELDWEPAPVVPERPRGRRSPISDTSAADDIFVGQPQPRPRRAAPTPVEEETADDPERKLLV